MTGSQLRPERAHWCFLRIQYRAFWQIALRRGPQGRGTSPSGGPPRGQDGQFLWRWLSPSTQFSCLEIETSLWFQVPDFLANLQAGLLVYAEVMALGVAYNTRLLANYYAVVQVHTVIRGTRTVVVGFWQSAMLKWVLLTYLLISANAPCSVGTIIPILQFIKEAPASKLFNPSLRVCVAETYSARPINGASPFQVTQNHMSRKSPTKVLAPGKC